MVTIDWGEFKEYRAHRMKQDDNFATLIEFLKSYYNMFSISEIYETLKNDDTACMMLDKRGLDSVHSFEEYLFQAH